MPEGPITRAVPQPPPRHVAGDTQEASFERPLFDVFSELAARQPSHPAVDDGTLRLTYIELRDRAQALGSRIAAQVPPGGVVGIALPITALFPVAWLACFAARRTFLPLDPFLPPARNQAIVAEAGLAAVIVPTISDDFAAWLPLGLPRVCMAEHWPEAEHRPEAEHGPEAEPLPSGRPPSPVGMIVFTSGSTGRAKGIALHERSTQRKGMQYRAVALGNQDRLLSLHPPTTSAGVRDVIGALLSGACLYLTDLKRDGPARTLALLRNGGVTVCATVPAVARALMAMDGTADAFRGLRIMRLGGDVILDSDITALATLLAPTARILVSFGMTEGGGALIQRLIDPAAPLESGRIAMGRPVAGQTVSVEDADGNPVQPGEAGELVIRGRYLALGHWVAGRLDPTGFPDDPAVPGSRSFRSADVMLLRHDGMLVPLGRADRQVKINGIRVEPGDTEAALRKLPGVADAAVVAHGTADAPTLVAFVVRSTDPAHRAQSDAQLARSWRTALAALLPPQLVPGRIRMLPAIPLLPSMKPDLAALHTASALDAADSGPGDAPADTSRMLAAVWRRLRRAALRDPAASQRRPLHRDGAAS